MHTGVANLIFHTCFVTSIWHGYTLFLQVFAKLRELFKYFTIDKKVVKSELQQMGVNQHASVLSLYIKVTFSLESQWMTNDNLVYNCQISIGLERQKRDIRGEKNVSVSKIFQRKYPMQNGFCLAQNQYKI